MLSGRARPVNPDRESAMAEGFTWDLLPHLSTCHSSAGCSSPPSSPSSWPSSSRNTTNNWPPHPSPRGRPMATSRWTSMRPHRRAHCCRRRTTGRIAGAALPGDRRRRCARGGALRPHLPVSHGPPGSLRRLPPRENRQQDDADRPVEEVQCGPEGMGWPPPWRAHQALWATRRWHDEEGPEEEGGHEAVNAAM